VEPGAQVWPRRAVLGAAALAAVALGPARPGRAAVRRRRAEERDHVPGFERQHLPAVELPVVAAYGAKVPLVVTMDHPMTPGHAVTTLRVVNPRDPVPSKGVFHFTPANGQVYLAIQVRLDQGPSDVEVTATCERHGTWATVRRVTVPDGAGGCAAPAPPRGEGGAIAPPAIRVLEVLRRTPIRPGDLVHVQVQLRHPNRTGLIRQDGRWVAVSPPFHLETMEVFYDDTPVSRFLLTAGLSDDPLITFRLRAARAGTIRVTVRNSRGERFDAAVGLPVA